MNKAAGGWYQGRLFALTTLRATASSSADVQCCVLEAYLVGILALLSQNREVEPNVCVI